jgi:hypothetical protein
VLWAASRGTQSRCRTARCRCACAAPPCLPACPPVCLPVAPLPSAPRQVLFAVKEFVKGHLGVNFIQSPPTTMADIHGDSDPSTPIIFILSVGAWVATAWYPPPCPGHTAPPPPPAPAPCMSPSPAPRSACANVRRCGCALVCFWAVSLSGADPTSLLYSFAKQRGVMDKLKLISLGQVRRRASSIATEPRGMRAHSTV